MPSYIKEISVPTVTDFNLNRNKFSRKISEDLIVHLLEYFGQLLRGYIIQ